MRFRTLMVLPLIVILSFVAIVVVVVGLIELSTEHATLTKSVLVALLSFGYLCPFWLLSRPPKRSAVTSPLADITDVSIQAAKIRRIPFLLSILSRRPCICVATISGLVMFGVTPIAMGILGIWNEIGLVVLLVWSCVALVAFVASDSFMRRISASWQTCARFVVLFPVFSLSAGIALARLRRATAMSGWQWEDWWTETRVVETRTRRLFRPSFSHRIIIGVQGCLMWVVFGLTGILVFTSGRISSVVVILFLSGMCLCLVRELYVARLLRRIASRFDVQSVCVGAVVLLRSFRADRETNSPESKPRFDTQTLEEQLSQAAGGPATPCITLGKPREKFLLTTKGAERFYVDDHLWQATIAKWISTSSRIIMVAGTTAGLDWELQEVKQRASLAKLLILLPASLMQVESQRHGLARSVAYSIGVPLSIDKAVRPVALAFDATGDFRVLVSRIHPEMNRANLFTTEYIEAMKWHQREMRSGQRCPQDSATC